MRIGVYSDSLAELPRREMLSWCAGHGVQDVELGVGAWGPWPRPHLDLATAGDRRERERLTGELKEYGVRLSAVNAAGNLLHPDSTKRQDAQARFWAAVELAVALGVTRLITMSGCPAGPLGGSLGVFPSWTTSADDERLFDWQLEHELIPFWRGVSERLAREAPGLMVCLEMHPGVTIFNCAGFQALAPHVGHNIGINLDPSHFWWQGIDPATILDTLGERVGWVHGKDTLLYPERIRRHGVLHYNPPGEFAEAPWHFAPVGEGHDDKTWAALLTAVRRVGYDGVVSIEHEDPRYDGKEGTRRSLDGLKRVLFEMNALEE